MEWCRWIFAFSECLYLPLAPSSGGPTGRETPEMNVSDRGLSNAHFYILNGSLTKKLQHFKDNAISENFRKYLKSAPPSIRKSQIFWNRVQSVKTSLCNFIRTSKMVPRIRKFTGIISIYLRVHQNKGFVFFFVLIDFFIDFTLPPSPQKAQFPLMSGSWSFFGRGVMQNRWKNRSKRKN